VTSVFGFLPGTEDTKKKNLRETTTSQELVLQRPQSKWNVFHLVQWQRRSAFQGLRLLFGKGARTPA